MIFRHVGSAYGREIFVNAEPETAEPASPQGYSIAAVVLNAGWKSGDVGSLLNQLYGALDDWTEFNSDAGARSFVFYGERSEEASDLCDAFAYAWTKGAESEYNDVIASSNDAPNLDAFVEGVISGEIAVGDAYAEKMQNVLFATQDEEPDRLAAIVTEAVKRHHFD